MAAKAKTAVRAASIVGACIVAIALVSGLFYEQAGRARDRERFPPVGRAVDIGGRTLNIDCAGEGRPPVILESGAPLGSLYTAEGGIRKRRSASRLQLGRDSARAGQAHHRLLV